MALRGLGCVEWEQTWLCGVFSFPVASELVQNWVLFCRGPLPSPLACRTDLGTVGSIAEGKYVNRGNLFASCWSLLSLKVTGWFVLLVVTSLELCSRRFTSSLAHCKQPRLPVWCALLGLPSFSGQKLRNEWWIRLHNFAHVSAISVSVCYLKCHSLFHFLLYLYSMMKSKNTYLVWVTGHFCHWLKQSHTNVYRAQFPWTSAWLNHLMVGVSVGLGFRNILIPNEVATCICTGIWYWILQEYRDVTPCGPNVCFQCWLTSRREWIKGWGGYKAVCFVLIFSDN